jgi:hypothetical protein
MALVDLGGHAGHWGWIATRGATGAPDLASKKSTKLLFPCFKGGKQKTRTNIDEIDLET